MRSVFAVVRVLTIFVSILIFLLNMVVVRALIRRRWGQVRWSNILLSRYSRFGLKVLNLRIRVVGIEEALQVRGGLFVGNHLSYMDVLAISAQIPTCFVTSREIKETPGLGLICEMAGCLFVERRNKNNIHNEISEIREGLQVGLNVAIFPEATSTNGEQILRFRRPLFIAAVDAGGVVVPFCLNYTHVGGEPINSVNRDRIMWYGDMGFVPHLWALASSGGVRLDLHFLKPVTTNLKMDATELAAEAQRAVESVFQPVVPAQ